MNTVIAERLLILLKKHFFSRNDRAAVAKGDGDPMPIITEDEANFEAILRTHLLGQSAPKATAFHITKKTRGASNGWFRVGSYTPTKEGFTRWLCIDIDGPGHADAVANPEAAAVRLFNLFLGYDLPVYLERSGGGKGWHVWLFFDEPVPAAKARELAFAVVPRDVPLERGGFAEPENNKGLEVFPKQDKARNDGYGNLIWLPWWSGARDGGNQFYRLKDLTLEPYVPEEFHGIAIAAVDMAIKRAGTDAMVSTYEAVPLSDGAAPKEPDFAEWRKRALAVLPLESVYGEWLTGRSSGEGWLECRDPESASGDQNPSAGVADGGNSCERGSFHSFITNKTMSVFDFLIRQGLAVDIRHAARRVAELSGVPTPASPRSAQGLQQPSASPQSPRQLRPTIQVNNRQLQDIVNDAWRSVLRANTGPDMFVRHQFIVRLRSRGEGLYIEEMTENGLYNYIAHTADWVKATQDALVDVFPHREVAKAMLVRPHWRLPGLEAVITSPVFGSSGHLISTPGYNGDEKVWYEPSKNLDVPASPEAPMPEEIVDARYTLLEDLGGDFPFVSESDRAHWLSALILPFVRRMIDGPTPLHFVEAPCNGAGKSLLCDMISIVATGHACSAQVLPRHDDEAAKTITAELLEGRPVILFDNQSERYTLNSTSLASALTTQHWTGRYLGFSRMITIPNNATWMMSGNNPNMTTEIARRCIRIRINPRQERAWQRDLNRFRHPHIKEWAKENRGKLIQAVHTLVRAWLAAGRPCGNASMGSFEAWAKVIGGILHVAGVPGFLGCLNEMYQQADADGDEWRRFVAAWWEEFADMPRKVSELNALCEQRELLTGLRGDRSMRSQETRLGHALNSMRDRIFDNKRISVAENVKYSKGARMYALVPEDDGPGSGEKIQLTQEELFPLQSPDAPAAADSGAENQCGHLSGAEPVQTLLPEGMQVVSSGNTSTSENSADLCIPFSESYAHVRARAYNIDNKNISIDARARVCTGGRPDERYENVRSGLLQPDATSISSTPSGSADLPVQTSQSMSALTERGPQGQGGKPEAGTSEANAPDADDRGDAWEDPAAAKNAGTAPRAPDPWDPDYDPANDPYCGDDDGDDES